MIKYPLGFVINPPKSGDQKSGYSIVYTKKSASIETAGSRLTPVRK
jgi:hypothetical protein